jgi:hypothetical protein
VLRTLARLGDPALSIEVLRLSGDALEMATHALVATHHQERVAEAARNVREAAAEAVTRAPPDLTAYQTAVLNGGVR